VHSVYTVTDTLHSPRQERGPVVLLSVELLQRVQNRVALMEDIKYVNLRSVARATFVPNITRSGRKMYVLWSSLLSSSQIWSGSSLHYTFPLVLISELDVREDQTYTHFSRQVHQCTGTTCGAWHSTCCCYFFTCICALQGIVINNLLDIICTKVPSNSALLSAFKVEISWAYQVVCNNVAIKEEGSKFKAH
jgi:hypothetical protein